MCEKTTASQIFFSEAVKWTFLKNVNPFYNELLYQLGLDLINLYALLGS